MLQTEKEINTRNLHEYMHESDPKIVRIMVQINSSPKLKILSFLIFFSVIALIVFKLETILSFISHFLEEKVPMLIEKCTISWI
ncbi:hypothetical protein IT403_00295 [Candidatus Nomurabacteria bacterium]|nr:hypothetical protein [Candidatus Nomurabacteria bacterium]